MKWEIRNGGMLRGRWRTTYVCPHCGHMVKDDHPDFKHTKRLHERAHEGQSDLFDQEATA